MARSTRLVIAKPDILALFKKSSTFVFSRGDLDEFLLQNREFWRLAKSTTTNQFIEFLLAATPMQVVRLAFPGRATLRYVWGTIRPFEVVQSLKERGYFTHYTAMHLHGLTEQIPKAIYFNFEQELTGGGGTLTQKGIDRAFQSKPRTSNNIAELQDLRICLLNGRNTSQLGVIDLDTSENGRLRTSCLERTLIDIVVRPVYSGGVFEVAKAYKLAQPHVSINKLTAYLKQLNYTYPYHQSIGFYLERSGVYKKTQIDLLRQFPIEFDFYLDHRIGSKVYNPAWRLFVPEGL